MADVQESKEKQKHLKYQKKYEKIKKLIKGLVYENAALCDEIASTQEMIMIFKEERKHLLIKVMACEKTDDQKKILPSTSKPDTKVKKRKNS